MKLGDFMDALKATTNSFVWYRSKFRRYLRARGPDGETYCPLTAVAKANGCHCAISNAREAALSLGMTWEFNPPSLAVSIARAADNDAGVLRTQIEQAVRPLGFHTVQERFHLWNGYSERH